MGTNGYQRIHLSVGRSWFESASPSAPERGLLPWLLGRGRLPVQTSSIPDTLDDRMKDSQDRASIKENPQLSLQKAEQSIASRYEVLMAVSVAIGTHHDIEGLFSALATELLRVVDFDFIGMSQYEESTKKVEWHLSKSGSQIERGVIDGTKEETMSAWVYQHQKPMIIGSLNHETKLHRKIKELAQDGIQSLCAFPLTCVHHRMGCFLIGNKQKDAYSEDEIRFLSVVTDMIASAVDDAINFDALRRTQAELRSERDRLQLLLELTSQIASNLELRELLRTVSATVRRVMRCDAVAVHLPDEERGCLRLFALDFGGRRSVTSDNSGLEESNSAEYISEVFRTRTPMVNDEGSATSHPEIFRDVPRCACSVPLISRNRVLGVMELWRPEAHIFTENDLGFLAQIATQVAIAVENALAYGEIKGLKNKLAREKLYLEDEIRSEQGFEEIIGRSAAIRSVLRKIETVAPTDSTVLIYGETGTGKELIARAIHERGPRRSNAFVKLNCAAIPTGLLESELFGHERGAFTGAIVQRIGRFELADRGTAFLDEIGEIALELQPKLLRVLQEREFERLGSARTLKTDARLIAATNRDLAACVEEQKFRADLFYRLNVFPIFVPPLRDRPDDIPLLVRHFVQYFARRMNRTIDTIPSETMDALVRHSWPGNIRELQNLIERSVILSPGPVLHVPLAGLHSSNSPRQDGARQRTLEEAEREHILATLKETKWRVSGAGGAAVRLGMNRSTLQFRMKKLGIARPGT
jgi:formate hydrogenlyase transcriptional activator